MKKIYLTPLAFLLLVTLSNDTAASDSDPLGDPAASPPTPALARRSAPPEPTYCGHLEKIAALEKKVKHLTKERNELCQKWRKEALRKRTCPHHMVSIAGELMNDNPASLQPITLIRPVAIRPGKRKPFKVFAPNKKPACAQDALIAKLAAENAQLHKANSELLNRLNQWKDEAM